MNCLLFGGDGFVGRPLAAELRRRGASVTVASRRGMPASSASSLACDIADLDQVRQALHACRPDVVVNLTGTGHDGDGCRTAVVGTGNLLTIVREMGAPRPRVVLFGSAAEYGSGGGRPGPIVETSPCYPAGAYGISKLAATRLALGCAEEWQLDVAVLRPFNVVGPGCPDRLLLGALVSRVLAAMRRGGPIEVRTGRFDTERDFVAVEDVADAAARVVFEDRPYGICNVCSGRPVRTAHLASLVAEAAGVQVAWTPDPALMRPDDPAIVYGSYAKLQSLTGFVPRSSVEDAVRATWAAAAQAGR